MVQVACRQSRRCSYYCGLISALHSGGLKYISRISNLYSRFLLLLHHHDRRLVRFIIHGLANIM